MKRIAFAALFTIFASGAYAAPVLTLTLIPQTATAMAGGVTGWGYDISNSDPTNFAVLNDSLVTGALSTGVFGHYVDYIASNFIVIGPHSDTGVVPFNRSTLSGVGEFDFNAVVPPNTRVNGAINIDYSLFSQDPNSDSFDPNSFVTNGTVSASATAQVVPEPGTGALMGSVALAMLVMLKRRAAGGAPGQ